MDEYPNGSADAKGKRVRTAGVVFANEAEALTWAKQAPTMMHGGGVELRPLMVRLDLLMLAPRLVCG